MRCSNCGAEIANDSKFCESCGKKVEQRNNRTLIYVMAGIIVVLGVIIGLGMCNHQKIDQNEEVEEIVQIDTSALEEEASATEQIEEQQSIMTQKESSTIVVKAVDKAAVKAVETIEKEALGTKTTAQNKDPKKNVNKTSAKSSVEESYGTPQTEDDEITTGGTSDQNVLTDKDKQAIRGLSDALSMTKIMFSESDDEPIIVQDEGTINTVVDIMKNNPQLTLRIICYASNKDLARRRANKVRNYYLKNGVKSAQMETSYYSGNETDMNSNYAVFRIIKK